MGPRVIVSKIFVAVFRQIAIALLPSDLGLQPFFAERLGPCAVSSDAINPINSMNASNTTNAINPS